MDENPITEVQVRAAAKVLGFETPEQLELVKQALEEASKARRADFPWGCHCEIEAMDDGVTPDGCVLDSGFIGDCIYAPPLHEAGKSKTGCEYWRQFDPEKYRKAKG